MLYLCCACTEQNLAPLSYDNAQAVTKHLQWNAAGVQLVAQLLQDKYATNSYRKFKLTILLALPDCKV